MASVARHRLWLRRLSWMVLLWGAGVAAIGVIASLLRVFMALAGMTT